MTHERITPARMTTDEVVDLLTAAAVYDGRILGEADAQVWCGQLAGLDFADAIASVHGWYADHVERITPANIRAGVRARRDARAALAGQPLPPADPDDPAAYIKALRAVQTAAGDGRRFTQPLGPGRVKTYAVPPAAVRPALPAGGGDQ